MNPLGTEFWQFFRKESFFQKNAKMIFFQRLPTLVRHSSAMTTDRRNFITKITLCGMSGFHFHRWNQSKSSPWSVHSVQETYPPNSLRCQPDAMPHNADGLSGCGLMTLLGEGKDRPLGYWYASNATMTLATVLSTIRLLFFWRYAPVRRTGTFFHVAGTDVEMCNSFNLKNIIRQFDSCTKSWALRAEYCIVGIQHNTAI